MSLHIKNNDKPFFRFLEAKWYIVLICLIGLLSFSLNFYAISKYGYGNEYYAAAVLSMTKSIKNFFFVSFDPSGLVSVDKPPVALWVQAILVLILGYHGWVLILPQALASTGSCIMIYILTNKYFGKKPALLSSFIFAITPIIVAVSRNNTMDMQLIFVLLLATRFLFKSLERNKWRYLFIAAILIGIGFNIKMLQAYLVLPAFVITYLIFAKEKVHKRFIGGFIATLIMIVISFSWATIVDLYPASDRPYVDSTLNNSVYELIFGHNGAERLFGKSYNSDEESTTSESTENEVPDNNSNKNKNFNVDEADNPASKKTESTTYSTESTQNQYSLNNDYIGTASIDRLWFSNIYGQISWLLSLALFSIVAFARKIKIKEASLKHSSFVFWCIWLFTAGIFFSFAGFYHRYYLCMIAPPIAVLSGTGIFKMLAEFKDNTCCKQLILPTAVALTMILQFVYVIGNDDLPSFLIPIMLLSTSLFFIFVAINYSKDSTFIKPATKLLMLIALLIAPLYWSITPVMYVPNLTKPSAGPNIGATGSDDINANTSGSVAGLNQSLNIEQYLIYNYKEGSYLVVSQKSTDIAKYIITSGLPCYAYGGFLGTDNSIKLDDFKALVAEGKIRYFLISTDDSDDTITAYVKKHGEEVDDSDISGGSSLIIDSDIIDRVTLYYLGN